MGPLVIQQSIELQLGVFASISIKNIKVPREHDPGSHPKKKNHQSSSPCNQSCPSTIVPRSLAVLPCSRKISASVERRYICGGMNVIFRSRNSAIASSGRRKDAETTPWPPSTAGTRVDIRFSDASSSELVAKLAWLGDVLSFRA